MIHHISENTTRQARSIARPARAPQGHGRRAALTLLLLLGCAPIQVGRTDDPGSSGGQASLPHSDTGGGQTNTRFSTGGQASFPRSTIGGASGRIGTPTGGTATGGTSDRGTGGASDQSTGGTSDQSTGGTSDQSTGGTSDRSTGGTSGSCLNALEVRGRVVSPTGEPLQGVRLSLSGQSNTTTLTDEKGQYFFNQICPGTYTLVPSRADLRFCSEQATLPNLTQSVDEDFTGSTNGCQTPEIAQRVAIFIFDPFVASSAGTRERLSKVNHWQDPSGLADQYRRTIETVTNGRIQYQLVNSLAVDAFPPKGDGFAYTEESYAKCLADSASCHKFDEADYQQLANDQGICDLVNAGTIDEVWLLGGPYFGFTLLQRLGPVAASAPLLYTLETGCMRAINVLGFSYERELDAFLYGLHEKAENILDPLFQGWNYDSLGTTWNRYTHVRLMSATYPVSGCGGHGYPPNASQSGQYDNTAFVDSYCDNFYADPISTGVTAPLKPVNCEAWGCSGLGFDRYWFRHLPALKGVDSDGMLADWWRYLLYPDDATAKPRAASGASSNPGKLALVTCSGSYASGWCNNVTDDHHGECNSNEWATPNLPTGWVEFSWPDAIEVSSVTLYDRACSEQVISGHLEFSDGSLKIGFGPLEDKGLIPEEKKFDNPKRLTWLRVVIDASYGDNPGFGEISIQ